MGHHFREVCKHGRVVRQCRCMGTKIDKVVPCVSTKCLPDEPQSEVILVEFREEGGPVDGHVVMMVASGWATAEAFMRSDLAKRSSSRIEPWFWYCTRETVDDASLASIVETRLYNSNGVLTAETGR